MSLPFWADRSDAAVKAWNTVTLGPVTLPGTCVVTAEKGREVDTKKSKGKDGPTMKDTGADQGKVTIEVTLATAEQWKEWQRIRPTIDPNRPGGSRNPLEIKHPEPADRGIQNVYVKSIKGMPPTAKGGKRYQLDCPEWVASPKTAKTNTKTLPAAKLRKNSFVSDVPGETAFGQDFVNGMTQKNF